ncbi:MAG TPA: carbon monoxide dehydrogenase subunit G [Vineibacter sp.]|nr:carbon monoxide dehydrogenase subunit G [Vineibacter sp.]
MDFSGEYRIPATREKVWEALNDPAILQQCIPGCETLEKSGDNELKATVRMKIGPVSAKFGGKVTLSDMDPPNGYRISGEGQGGAAGFAKGGAVVKLTEADGGGTVLNYTADAQVGGKIAQIGARLIDGTAKKLADEFFSKFSEVVGGGAPAAAEAAPAADEPAPSPAPAAAPSTASNGSGAGVNSAGSPARPATDSAERGYKHWLLIGAGVAILVIAYFAIR